MNSNEQQTKDKLSIILSVFIALCVVFLFCTISIAVAKNIDTMSQDFGKKHVLLPRTNPELTKFVF